MAIAISPVNMEARQEIGIKAGDTVRVYQKVEEKGKIRLQAFEGVVIARKHGNEPGATFTVRRTTGGYGVEKIFPLYSPNIDKIEIVKRAKVRRAKLYHIREKAARAIRRQMRNMMFVDITTGSDMEAAAEAEQKAKEAEEAAAKAEEEKAAKEAEEKAAAEAPIEEEKTEEEKKSEEAPAETEETEE